MDWTEETFGIPGEGEYSYDHYVYILDNIDSHMSLYGYNVCNIPIGGEASDRTRIGSIILEYANEDASEIVELPEVGPHDASGCERV